MTDDREAALMAENKSSTINPPDLTDRYAAAIAEAGYPGTVVLTNAGKPVLVGGGVPVEVMYKAFLVVRRLDCCFDCWDRNRHAFPSPPLRDCPHGATPIGLIPQDQPE